METIKFRPSFSKIVAAGLLMGCVLFPPSILLVKDEIFDLGAVALTLMVVLWASILFCFILFKLPYFSIEVTDRHVFGPYLLATSWQQVHVPIEEIDLQNIRSFRWAGFYLLRSVDGAAITVCCLDENRFDQLIAALTSRKVKSTNS